jgi:putative transposase
MGAPKIREKLARLYPDVHTPAISTVHAVLDRHGLVQRRMGRRNRAKGTALSPPGQPNDLWCADYKGEFMLADRRYCYPLTITDFASRYLFVCEALSTTKEAYAFPAFEAVSRSWDCPKPSAPTTASPSQAPTRFTASASCRRGGSGSASRSSGSSRATRNRTAAMNACI